MLVLYMFHLSSLTNSLPLLEKKNPHMMMLLPSSFIVGVSCQWYAVFLFTLFVALYTVILVSSDQSAYFCMFALYLLHSLSQTAQTTSCGFGSTIGSFYLSVFSFCLFSLFPEDSHQRLPSEDTCCQSSWRGELPAVATGPIIIMLV